MKLITLFVAGLLNSMVDPGCIAIHFGDSYTVFLWQSDSMDNGFCDELYLEVEIPGDYGR